MKHLSKKLLAVLLCALLLLSLLPATAFAAETQGTCGENLTWVYTPSSKTLRISGTGSMQNYEPYNAPWNNSSDEIETLIIDEGVTTIGSNAFRNTGVSTVKLPSTLVVIGDHAFYFCSSLEAITFPDGLASVGASAFEETELEQVTIPASLTQIGDAAFLTYVSLEKFTVSENNPAFTTDQYGVLYSKDMTKLVQYPNALRSSHPIPNSVVELGAYAFSLAWDANITLPDSLEIIGAHCFDWCLVEGALSIPAKVRSIGEHAFDASAITAFNVDSQNPYYSSDAFGVLFDKAKETLIRCPSFNFVSSYTIPHSVTTIDPYAFYQCTGLKSVTLPQNLKKIGDSAFSDCLYLASINIPDSVTSIGEYAFSHCSRLESINIPNSVSSMGEYAFYYCTGMKKAVVSAHLETLPAYSFNHCEALESISLPEGLRTIEKSSFTACKALKALTLPGSVTSIAGSAFVACTALEELSIPQGVTKIGSYAFDGCTSLVSITLPGTVSEWGYNIFAECDALKHVVFTGTENQAPDWHTAGLSSTALKHYNATGTEAHWVTKGSSSYFYCDLCKTVLIGDADAAANPFTDVARGIYYYDPVMWAVENGITTGATATTFAPEKDCTRGQIVTFLWRAYGSPEPTVTTHSFTDISENAYYYKAVLWAVEKGITTGMTTTTFAPEKSCTRAQAVTFLWRAQEKPTPAASENPFKDVAEKDYFHAPVLWALEEGITTGTSADKFSPNNTCTRAQIVTFLYRTLSEK